MAERRRTPGVRSSVSIDELMRAQENVEPARRGRDAGRMRRGIEELDKAPAVRREREAAERARHERAVAEYEGDDPLQPWLRYIRWTRAAIVSGGARARLVPLLEACTRKFKDDERYRDEERYLDVWLMYAEQCATPEDIFGFMRANNIAQSLARFYAAWAATLEDAGRHDFAERVLRDGILRSAAPRERLRRELENLQQRAVARIRRRIEEGDDPAEAPEPPAAVRPAGGLRTAASLARARAPARAPARRPSARAGLVTAASRAAAARSAARAPVSGNAGTFVFCDDDDDDGGGGGGGANAVPQPGDGSWAELGTQRSRDAENAGEVTTWNQPLPRAGSGRGAPGLVTAASRRRGTTAPAPRAVVGLIRAGQRRAAPRVPAAVAAQSPAFEIFEDESAGEPHDGGRSGNEPASPRANRPSLRARLDAPSPAEALAGDPLWLHHQPPQ